MSESREKREFRRWLARTGAGKVARISDSESVLFRPVKISQKIIRVH